MGANIYIANYSGNALYHVINSLNTKNVCVLENTKIVFSVRVYKDLYSVFFPTNFSKKIMKCIKSGQNSAFLILGVRNDLVTGHTNALIFNYINNVIEIERYEPHGSGGNYTHFIDQFLEKLLKTEFPKYTVKYFSPLEYCPYIGAQIYSKDEIGYCSLFSAMYIFDRLTHPELTRNEVANLHNKKKPKELLKEIKEFETLLLNYPKVSRLYYDDPEHYTFKGFFPTEAFLKKKVYKAEYISNALKFPLDYIEIFDPLPKGIDSKVSWDPWDLVKYKETLEKLIRKHTRLNEIGLLKERLHQLLQLKRLQKSNTPKKTADRKLLKQKLLQEQEKIKRIKGKLKLKLNKNK